MGCHTWYYKPINQPTTSAMRTVLLDYHTALIDSCDRLNLRDGNNCWDSHKYSSVRILHWLTTKRISHPSTIYRMWVHTLGINQELNNQLYLNIDWPSCFRVSDYPETILTSRECALRYVSTIECDLDKLNQFWDKYPDGIIAFG